MDNLNFKKLMIFAVAVCVNIVFIGIGMILFNAKVTTMQYVIGIIMIMVGIAMTLISWAGYIKLDEK